MKSGHSYLQHECMRRVDKNGGIVLWRRLKAKLGVCSTRVVSEGNTRGQFAIIE